MDDDTAQMEEIFRNLSKEGRKRLLNWITKNGQE